LRVSVVIPVKDGARYLRELLDALLREGVDEVLVIDSGSRDDSCEIVRTARASAAARATQAGAAHTAGTSTAVELLEIDPAEFGHGRTRNLGAERTSGELICFLTQDATPLPGWLEAYREAFALDPHVGAAYGPHLPRPGTSPMIARELVEFFAGFAPDGRGGRACIQRAGDPSFLSNVNACYARACWEEIGFRELPYSEDQAFGADLLAAGWAKVYHPRAAVLHAHDYGPLEFMRRYFDEYRGLRESTGHVEPFGVLASARQVRHAVAGDRRWMAERGLPASERARWTARAVAHHGSRRVFSALGSRAERVPAPLRRRLSLEGRDEVDGGAADGTGAGARASAQRPQDSRCRPPASLPAPKHISAVRDHDDYEDAVRVWREGPALLLDPIPGMAERERLRIAMVIPSFRRGSGGHGTLMQILTRLERRGHVCSVWLHDFTGQHRAEWPGVIRADINDFFAPMQGPVYKGFAEWQGADVVIATGWQTVHPTLLLDQCRARVYLVNDHEPDFYSASTERELARDTYRHGLHPIAASPWLRDLLVDRYGPPADAFQLGVDHAIYGSLPEIPRHRDTVIYYARHATPRRAAPIGLMALSELHRRRPDTRIVLFGDPGVLESPFPYEHHGVLSPQQLARLYNEATVGLCLSLTNFSLMPKEMLACGLPCVELAGVSAESIFGADGPLELAPLEPHAIADALERLLEDRALWEQRSRAGIEFVAAHTWDRAAEEVEAGLRHALRAREGVPAEA
jgi:glycosyltransferase involved in cell wall biosynthesis